MISLPFSIFPQIRQVPPCSEIWHKDLKFQRAKKKQKNTSVISPSPLCLSPSMYLFGSLHTIITQHAVNEKPISHLLRKVFPKGLSLRKGLLGSTIRAFPGMTLSTSPCMMAVKQSVVGSGPTLLPGMSCSSRYLSITCTHCDFLLPGLIFTKCMNHTTNALLDECCLPSGVLSHHQHHRLVVKVCIFQTGRVEVMETIVLLQRQQLLSIQGLEPLCHGADNLRCLLHIFAPPA